MRINFFDAEQDKRNGEKNSHQQVKPQHNQKGDGDHTFVCAGNNDRALGVGPIKRRFLKLQTGELFQRSFSPEVIHDATEQRCQFRSII